MIALDDLLALALPAIYLFDSAQFLSVGEAMLTTRVGAIRGVSCGSRFELGGRRPFLPNPLTPFWPDLRLEWISANGAWANVVPMGDDVHKRLRVVRPIGWICALTALLIVLVAPVCLVLRDEAWFVACAILSFILTTAACVLVLIRRRDMGLTRWQAWSSVLIALVCIPCGPNLARAVLLHRRWAIQASSIVVLGFDPGYIEAVRNNLVAGLIDALRVLPDDSAEHRLVSEQLVQLRGGSA